MLSKKKTGNSTRPEYVRRAKHLARENLAKVAATAIKGELSEDVEEDVIQWTQAVEKGIHLFS